jgi:HSP20 family molecular chaperone IbpA
MFTKLIIAKQLTNRFIHSDLKVINPFKRWLKSNDPLDSLQKRDWDPFLRFPTLPVDLFNESLIQLDVKENQDSYEIEADVPGIKKEEIKVNLDHGILKISGERKKKKEEKGANFLRTEKFYGKFERMMELPENVDEDSIKADYKDGVLHLKISK